MNPRYEEIRKRLAATPFGTWHDSAGKLIKVTNTLTQDQVDLAFLLAEVERLTKLTETK